MIQAIFHGHGHELGELSKDNISKFIPIVSELIKQPGKTNLATLTSPRIHIVYVSGSQSFYLYGEGLASYHMMLPKFVVNNGGRMILVGPKTGTHHSKWYTLSDFVNQRGVYQKMFRIAVYLLAFDEFLGSVTISDYETKEFGILESEVIVESEDDQQFQIDFDARYGTHDPKLNPKKVAPGKFCFGINGVSEERTRRAITDLLAFPRFIGLHDEYVSTRATLAGFIGSASIVAYCGWSRHARVLFKDTDSMSVFVLDPWMKNITRDPQFSEFKSEAEAQGWKFVFLPRRINDQIKGEGSCVLVAIARGLHILDGYNHGRVSLSDFNTMINEPIPDQYALISSVVYRN